MEHQPQLFNPLHVSDDLQWHEEKNYSAHVAANLARVHRAVKRALPTPHRFEEARILLGPLLSRRMSRHQRLNVTYLQGIILGGDGAYASALHFLDSALNLAEELDEPGALAEVAYLQGGMLRALCRHSRAADFQTRCLQTLWESSPDDQPIDPLIELSALLDLAMSEALLAHFDRADWCLQEARRLTDQLPRTILERALISWIQAVLSRWRGHAMEGLGLAMQACDAYLLGAPLSAQSRIQAVVADLAMDVSEEHQRGPIYLARSAMLDLAWPYVNQAVQRARDAQDRAGEGLALLALARHQRLSGQNTDRLEKIESVITMAEQLDDAPLAGQAYIALGAELIAIGASRDVEIRCYEKAIAILARSDAHAIELQARRALLRAREMHP